MIIRRKERYADEFRENLKYAKIWTTNTSDEREQRTGQNRRRVDYAMTAIYGNKRRYKVNYGLAGTAQCY